MHAPQIIYICLMAVNFGLSWANHGKPYKLPRSAWDTLIGMSIMVPLLIWGGFFSH